MDKYKFNTLFQFLKKSKIKAGEGKLEGEYPFYTSSQELNKYIDVMQHDIEALVFGTGGMASIHYVNSGFSTSTDCFVVTQKKDDFFTKFVYYFFIANFHILENGFKGAGLKHISKKYIEDIEIPVIDKNEQKNIIKKLDKAQELIDLRKDSIAKLDELAKSIFIDIFGDPVSNPKGWEVKKLGVLTNVKTGKTPSRKEPLYWENGTELWATTTEVNKRFIYDTEEKITKYAVEKCNLTVYPENTILIAMYGQGKTRGNVVLLRTQSTINQAFGAILASKNINQLFLLSLLKNSYSHIRSLGRGGNQENLNLDIVKSLDIINPPIDQQNKFAAIIEKIEEQKSLYEQDLEKLEENFQALLQQSFKE